MWGAGAGEGGGAGAGRREIREPDGLRDRRREMERETLTGNRDGGRFRGRKMEGDTDRPGG